MQQPHDRFKDRGQGFRKIGITVRSKERFMMTADKIVTDKIDLLNKWISQSDNVVFFGGAGVSTESGIPDYRSRDGLYNQTFRHPPEIMLSRSFYEAEPAEFYRFYRSKMVAPNALPNAAHLKLASLEKSGRLKGVITQNIDGLHQAAGSVRVTELHGSVHRNFCRKCGAFYDLSAIVDESSPVPKCSCGGTIKPSVVLYEEPLDNDIIGEAVSLIAQADVLIIGGTSLAVYPAAGLIDVYRGDKLAVINLDETDPSHRADLFIRGKIGEILSRIDG